MNDAYQIVDLPSGHCRAECTINDSGEMSYRSATFSTRSEARAWIATQQREVLAEKVGPRYVTQAMDSGTWVVRLWHDGRDENLGHFDTEDQAQEFVRRMQVYDSGPTHGMTDKP